MSTDPTAATTRPLLDAMLEVKEQLPIVVLPPSRSAPPMSGVEIPVTKRASCRRTHALVNTPITGGQDKYDLQYTNQSILRIYLFSNKQ